jgi:hypothetical protein
MSVGLVHMQPLLGQTLLFQHPQPHAESSNNVPSYDELLIICEEALKCDWDAVASYMAFEQKNLQIHTPLANV